tara:strand:+ start:1359 stop:2159 length:801 start_codon:yes stop_codon:yes gene_type:complete
MINNKKIILIPAYNEESCLSDLIMSVSSIAHKQNWNYKIVLCNDGSIDKTGLIARELKNRYPMEIIYHKINRGLGETERDLFERAAELVSEKDVIIRVEGDNTHKPEYMINLVDELDKGYDVAVCSRFAKGGGQKGLNVQKSFISNCANMFMKFFFPIKGLKEYSCGYRAYRGGIIKTAVQFYGNDFIQLKGFGFTCTLEVIVKLSLLSAKFSEIPFVLRYDHKKSESKMIGSITMLGYFLMTLLYHWPFGGWRNGYRKKLQKDSL